MGEVFAGRYELVDPIGRGGVGAVWRAWDQRRRRYVAAKVLQQSDAHTLLRFVREQALRIDHPHVLAPASWAADDDKVLFTMDLVGGGSFAHLIGDYGPLPPRYVCVLLDQLLSGLAAVHAEGVVHRDIKPANILLEATGVRRPHVRLSDFGIALTKGEPRLTEADFVMGTPGYFAPEQMRGADPDFPADLFAVGLVALYLITGRKPDAEALVRRFEELGIPNAPDAIPEPLWQVVANLLQPDPEARFRTANGARKALGSALELLPEPDLDDEVIEVFDQLGPLPAGYGPDGPERKGSRSHRKPPSSAEATTVSPVPPTVSDTGSFPLPPPQTAHPGQQPGQPRLDQPQPGTTPPGTPQPGTPGAGAAQPGRPDPGRLQPGVPGTGQPQPGAAHHGQPQPDAAQPGAAHPGSPQYGLPQPPVARPEVARPEVPQPTTPQPGTPGSGPHAAPYGTPMPPGRFGQPDHAAARPGDSAGTPVPMPPHTPVPPNTPPPSTPPPAAGAAAAWPTGTPESGSPAGTPPGTPLGTPPRTPASGHGNAPTRPYTPPGPQPRPGAQPVADPRAHTPSQAVSRYSPPPASPASGAMAGPHPLAAPGAPTPHAAYDATPPGTVPGQDFPAPGPGSGPGPGSAPIPGSAPGLGSAPYGALPGGRSPGTGSRREPGPPAKVVVPVLLLAALCFAIGIWALVASG